MKRRIFLFSSLILAVCSTTAPLPAQSTYTLEQCLDEALRNNIKIKNAERDLEVAQQEKRLAFTHYFPSIEATGGAFTTDRGLIKTALLPGQTISMVDDGMIGTVAATLPLFTGGQIVNKNRLAEVGVTANRLQQSLSRNEVLLTTEQYFWQIVSLKEKLRTIAAAEAQLERFEKDAQNSVDAGINTRNDLLRVQLRRNEMHNNRISAENGLRTSLRLLAQYMGHAEENIEIDYQLADSLPPAPQALYTAPENALLLTQEYGLLQQNVKASRLQQKLALGKNLPTVAVGGGYAWENLLDHSRSHWIGFATVSIPLTDWWGGSHEVKGEKLKVKSAESELQDKSQLLLIHMQNCWDEFNDAFRQIQLALSSIKQAEENLRLQTDYYAAGTCSMADLLDAQTLFCQAHDQYADAYARYALKKREYLQATGR